jgi:hypothetical protein
VKGQKVKLAMQRSMDVRMKKVMHEKDRDRGAEKKRPGDVDAEAGDREDEGTTKGQEAVCG